jgi:23S rRNA (uracil1939-C5)-methyltransferase
VCEALLTDPSPLNGLVLQSREWRKGWGRTRISIALPDGLSLSVEADVFTQVNPHANHALIGELLAAANFTRQDRVLELYCGAGNFTLPIAKRVADVVAVEGSAASIASGKYSAELNHLENVHWLHAPVPKAVRQLKRDRGQYSKLVLDPPRTGAKDIQDDLASLSIDKIFYVSCNPATLSRDLAALAQHGYKLTLVQPIDLFPHTFHVETLALAERS